MKSQTELGMALGSDFTITELFQRGAVTAAWAGSVALCAAGAALAEEGRIAFDAQPPRLFQFETAETYHGGTLALSVGAMQTSPDPSVSNATGNEVYFGGGSYSVTDRLTFGVDLQSYLDPTLKPINGAYPSIKWESIAFWGKYKLFDGERLDVSTLVAYETIQELESPLWGGTTRGIATGVFKLPVSYQASDRVALHVTPSVTVLPNSVKGQPFYGTIASLGFGASVRAHERLTFYGAVDMPVSGGNTIASDGSFKKVPVVTAGLRYSVTPRLALDAFVTNGVGTTPGTSILTFWPEGDTVLGGLRLTYTPGAKRPVSYRGVPAPVSVRQAHLQYDGFTMGRADTMDPGMFRVSAWSDNDDAHGVQFGFSPEQDFEVQFIWEKYAENPTKPGGLLPADPADRYMLGGKLRFMDQNNGNPFSLSGRVLFGRQVSTVVSYGVFFVEGLASYKSANGRLTLTANPKVAGFSSTRIAGMGLGVNYALGDQVELIAEATPVGLDGDTPTWSAGLRYNIGKSGFTVDALATNAAGRFGIGGMVAQSETRYALMLSKTFDLKRWKRW